MMTLAEAIQFLKLLIEQTQEKGAVRTYTSFLTLLEDLQNKDLTKVQEDKINQKLSELEINASVDDQKTYIRKAFVKFKAFLKEAFSFIPKGYYSGMHMTLGMSIGISIGLSMGMVFGIPFGMPMGMVYGMMIGMTLGMCIGMAIGVISGAAKDALAVQEDRIVSTRANS